MKEETKDTIKNVAFWTVVGAAYIGICYLSIKGAGKIIGKEVAKYVVKTII